MNGGFFVFSKEFFDYLREGEEMVAEPFDRLVAEDRLCTMRYSGFWSCMDTYKELQMLHDMYGKDDTPWALWNKDKKPAVCVSDGTATLSSESSSRQPTPK